MNHRDRTLAGRYLGVETQQFFDQKVRNSLKAVDKGLKEKIQLSTGSLSAINSHSQLPEQTQQPAAPKPKPTEPVADSVQLSHAAQSQLKGGDVDGDGDGH